MSSFQVLFVSHCAATICPVVIRLLFYISNNITSRAVEVFWGNQVPRYQVTKLRIKSQVIWDKSRSSLESSEPIHVSSQSRIAPREVPSYLRQVQIEAEVIQDKSESSPKSFQTSPSQVWNLLRQEKVWHYLKQVSASLKWSETVWSRVSSHLKLFKYLSPAQVFSQVWSQLIQVRSQVILKQI